MDIPERPRLRPDVLRRLLVGEGRPLRRLEVVEESPSTNDQLAAAVRADPDAWPAPALLVAEHQSAGKGRAGRTWTTTPRSSLVVSLLVRPPVPVAALTWLPLLAGLATAHALRATAGVAAVVKWPNDVLVPVPDDTGGPRKVVGILAEALGDGAVVVGLGVNVSQTPAELPVPTATSLLLAGAATTDREVLLTALHESFGDVLGRWRDAGGDAVGAGLRDECAAVCVSVGARVRVEPAAGAALEGAPFEGAAFEGEGTGLDDDGALLVRDASGAVRRVVAGDVHHARLAGTGD
ncbi:biotin--[acetyl-CoA-carboxylase] ligase [Cellulomonas sp. PhB143]|uniref:biotin--[acetyl-CoA-carboxylase] ligase n=1 Tax=Cellulomonas sp. PhB143 TaxID=2485186 RepID=UPI000F484C13|nr:biotin--[acetyl-CoA-carboxylase] ligase [Cellulomonas sp. PhB143]ROS76978.1 BirA family biotin operon repressor/biotin-[acetyl-CoA-carboxylase] ligase [Cellulomonas sp. PhB143]